MIFKKHVYLFLLTTLAGKAAFAGLASRIATLEQQMDEISTKTAEGNIGGKTASAWPQIPGQWFVSADFLCWHANEGGADYAVRFNHPPFDQRARAINHRVNFDWNFGFRAGIGTRFHHDQWDLAANFTWFQADKSTATFVQDGAFVIPLLGPIFGASANQATKVKAHWDILFYNLDLNLGRHLFINRRIALHPFAGIKLARIAQNVRTRADLFSPVDDRLCTKTRNHFWGIGPNLGVEGKWFIGDHFNFFSSLAGSLLWGDFDVHQRQRLKFADQTTFNVKFDKDAIVPMTQIQVGIGYEKNLHCNRYHLGVNLRYEYQYWWQQNQMPYFPEPVTFKYQCFAEDLSLEGVTFDVRFDF